MTFTGRRGYVPHNMVMEVEGGQNRDRDRWGDIYATMPMKRMVALYDYDPQELSPNVDAEVSPRPVLACVSQKTLTHLAITHLIKPSN